MRIEDRNSQWINKGQVQLSYIGINQILLQKKSCYLSLLIVLDMDKRTTSPVSAADSFFFQLIPKYFKVEHAFAKTIKPNTTYRLSVFKGIQPQDQMAEGIKSKLVGGKIIFDKTILNFYLPLYSPARNIEFTIKVLETKPGEEQVVLTSCKIKSGDYIKQFKSDNVTYSREEVQLVDSLALVYDLFVHSSKTQLEKVVNQNLKKSKIQSRSSLIDKRGSKTPRKNEVSSEILSQSDASQTNSLNRNSGIFASKKKLVRKRGHDGKLKSKHGSRQGSEVGSSRSRSSRKSFGPFPHNEQNQHFVRSPKKVSPPKVQESSNIQSDVKPAKRQNLVTVGRRQSDIYNEKGVRNTTPTKMGKTTNNRQRSQSAKKPPRSSILDINTPTTDRKANNNAKQGIHQLQIATKQNMFDIKNKNQTKSPEVGRIQRQKQSAPPIPSKVTPSKSGIRTTQESKVQQVKKKQSKVTEQPENAVQQPISKPTEQKIKNEEKVQAQSAQPAQQQDNFSSKKDRKISVLQIKQKPLMQQGDRQKAEKKMKASVRLPTAPNVEHQAEEQVSKQYEGMKDKLFYLVFVIVSAVLFWNAVTPSRKV